MSAAAEVEASSAPEKPRHYGFSALLTGFTRVWRAPAAIWAAILVNALAQALLIWPDPVASASLVFLLLALASLVVALLAAAVITASALETVTGRASLGTSGARARRNLGGFSAWFVLLLLALLIGTMLYTVPGVVVAVVTPYVLLAAMDGHSNAILADLRAIASRPGRWLVTALLMGLVVAISWLLAAVVMFFVTGPPAAFVMWVWFGFLFAWFQCTWAAVFRSTEVGRLPLESVE